MASSSALRTLGSNLKDVRAGFLKTFGRFGGGQLWLRSIKGRAFVGCQNRFAGRAIGRLPENRSRSDAPISPIKMSCWRA